MTFNMADNTSSSFLASLSSSSSSSPLSLTVEILGPDGQRHVGHSIALPDHLKQLGLHRPESRYRVRLGVIGQLSIEFASSVLFTDRACCCCCTRCDSSGGGCHGTRSQSPSPTSTLTGPAQETPLVANDDGARTQVKEDDEEDVFAAADVPPAGPHVGFPVGVTADAPATTSAATPAAHIPPGSTASLGPVNFKRKRKEEEEDDDDKEDGDDNDRHTGAGTQDGAKPKKIKVEDDEERDDDNDDIPVFIKEEFFNEEEGYRTIPLPTLASEREKATAKRAARLDHFGDVNIGGQGPEVGDNDNDDDSDSRSSICSTCYPDDSTDEEDVAAADGEDGLDAQSLQTGDPDSGLERDPGSLDYHCEVFRTGNVTGEPLDFQLYQTNENCAGFQKESNDTSSCASCSTSDPDRDESEDFLY